MEPDLLNSNPRRHGDFIQLEILQGSELGQIELADKELAITLKMVPKMNGNRTVLPYCILYRINKIMLFSNKF